MMAVTTQVVDLLSSILAPFSVMRASPVVRLVTRIDDYCRRLSALHVTMFANRGFEL